MWDSIYVCIISTYILCLFLPTFTFHFLNFDVGTPPLPFIIKNLEYIFEVETAINFQQQKPDKMLSVDWNQQFLFYYNWLAFWIFFTFDGCSFSSIKTWKCLQDFFFQDIDPFYNIGKRKLALPFFFLFLKRENYRFNKLLVSYKKRKTNPPTAILKLV